jgi:hypothetical protein
VKATAANGPPAAPAPKVTAQFDRVGRDYEPQQDLTIRYQVEGIDDAVVTAIERSVLWYTEGKGEEDLGIHVFERIDDAQGLAAAVPEASFAVHLPTSPLSYEGVIVKVRWCVRVRLFFAVGRDFVSEHVFDIGRTPPARRPLEPLGTTERA